MHREHNIWTSHCSLSKLEEIFFVLFLDRRVVSDAHVVGMCVFGGVLSFQSTDDADNVINGDLELLEWQWRQQTLALSFTTAQYLLLGHHIISMDIIPSNMNKMNF